MIQTDFDNCWSAYKYSNLIEIDMSLNSFNQQILWK